MTPTVNVFAPVAPFSFVPSSATTTEQREAAAAACDAVERLDAKANRHIQRALNACCSGHRILNAPLYTAVREMRDAYDWHVETRRLALRYGGNHAVDIRASCAPKIARVREVLG